MKDGYVIGIDPASGDSRPTLTFIHQDADRKREVLFFTDDIQEIASIMADTDFRSPPKLPKAHPI